MSNVYLHSIKTTGDIKDIDGSLVDLESILDTGAILTRRARNLIGFGFNGTKYLSLSDYDKRYNNIYYDDEVFYDYTAYEMYSTKALSIMIDKAQVKAITPNLVKPLDNSFMSFIRMYAAAFDLISERMSDLPDEVQVYGNIYEEAFKGITIPVKEINDKVSYNKLLFVYKRIRELLEKYEYYIGIYDVETLKPINEEKELEEIVKRCH